MNEKVADNDLTNTLYESLRSVAPNAELNGESTKLLGAGAVLDSVAFLGFLMSAETALGNSIDLSAALIEHGETDPADSPFHTIGSLASYIEKVRG